MILIFWVLILIYNFQSQNTQSDIEKAKQDLGVIRETLEVSQSDEVDNSTDQEPAEKQIEVGIKPTNTTPQEVQQEEYMTVELLSWEDIFSFSMLSAEKILASDELEIRWTLSQETESVSVEFSNATSDYPDDNYTLQKFQKWDTNFLYRASSKYQVLDYGVNEYIFTAKTQDGISKAKVTIIKPQENISQGEEAMILWEEDNLISLELPKSSVYGEPIKLWESTISYTGLKGIEIQRETTIELTGCEWLTDFLSQRINSWYYWNTCRPIGETGLSYNVLRLEGTSYIYERHYVDIKKSLYAKYFLEKGTGVSSENIREKNTQLKEREFPSADIADTLMKDVITS